MASILIRIPTKISARSISALALRFECLSLTPRFSEVAREACDQEPL
jgi:hypothetical protein